MMRRKVQRRRYKAHTYFPATDHRGEIIMSERRHLPTRRDYDISVVDIDFSSDLFEIDKQA